MDAGVGLGAMLAGFDDAHAPRQVATYDRTRSSS
jgi:hypothetical protein